MITTRPQLFNRLTSKELLCVVKVGLKQEQRTKTGHFELSKNDVVYKVLYFRIKQITKSYYAIKVRKKTISIPFKNGK